MSVSDIYEKEQTKNLEEVFANPGSIFRGAPFWSWNNRLDPEQLCRQIEIFKEMGLGGFHMHSRTGMATPYLSDEFMAAVKACVDKAEREGMHAWLYDEDRWPSGAAGGLVTQEKKYRARHLLFTPVSYEEEGGGYWAGDSSAKAGRTGNGELLARYLVKLKDGMLTEYRRLTDNETVADEGGSVWYAYLETALPSTWFNNQTYVDTLNPDAIRRFIEVTHERYRQVTGDRFGTTIPAIFTDEPQFARKTTLAYAEEKKDVLLPFTTDFPATFYASWRMDILDFLPELVWELHDGRVSVARYRFHDHVAERFASAFADTIGQWCEANQIALTGHLMEEPTLESQTNALGEAMRGYRSFQLPGIDILCDKHEYTTAKQAQSAARQFGRNGVLSELYGVTNWDYDFAGHKSQGDWQAALGVTVRVHHLSWVSMAGEAKRDYPASISYQSPWYRQYPIVEDHFARVNSVMTRGRPQVRVGMIHPIESYWIHSGPHEQTAAARQELDEAFQQTTNWLLFGQIDFDYICESLLPDLNSAGRDKQFQAGEMKYDAVVVPPTRTLRETTVERLETFAAAGGLLVFCGRVADLVDAEPSDRVRELARQAEHAEFAQSSLLEALNRVRDLDIRVAGRRAANLLHQYREEGGNKYLFICNTDRQGKPTPARIRIRGKWQVSVMDTFTGAIDPAAAEQKSGWIELERTFHPHDHLLLKLESADQSAGRDISEPAWNQNKVEKQTLAFLEGPVPVSLDEPNCLVLDQAEWRLNEGEWQPREEILRLDNQVRAQIGLSPRGGKIAQPWCRTDDETVLENLELRFDISCVAPVTMPKLAIEDPGTKELFLDGGKLEPEKYTGWWVDEAIRTVVLPSLDSGNHELIIRIAYTQNTDLECFYLLGDFGVEFKKGKACLTEPVRELDFGDWTKQGLPFYTGNITYHCSLETAAAESCGLRAPHFAGAMLGAELDGQARPGIVFAPCQTELGKLEKGNHKLDLTLFGNRYNAFGQLHWARPAPWAGPQSWRTVGDEWCYEYQLKPMGILTAPRLVKLS